MQASLIFVEEEAIFLSAVFTMSDYYACLLYTIWLPC